MTDRAHRVDFHRPPPADRPVEGCTINVTPSADPESLDYEDTCPGCRRELTVCDAPQVIDGRKVCAYCSHEWPAS